MVSRWEMGNFLRQGVVLSLLGVWLMLLMTAIGESTKVPNMSPFYVYLAILFALEWVVPWKWVRWPAQVTATLVTMYAMYFAAVEPLYDPAWLIHLQAMWLASWPMMMSRTYLDVAEPIRTLGFLLFLWLAVSVYRGALRSRGWLFVLLVTGIVVIGILDTFFVGVDGKWYIIGYFSVGLFLLSLTHVPTLEDLAGGQRAFTGWPLRWVGWSLAVVVAAAGTGMVAPKPGPTWPDPMGMLQGKGTAVGTGPHKIGYSSDTSVLGGPYQTDDTIAFTVITPEDGYYRGESKEYYTGKGWLSYGQGEDLTGKPVNQLLTKEIQKQYALETNMKTQKIRQQITIQNGTYPVMFSQYQLKGIDKIDWKNIPLSPLVYNPVELKVNGSFSPGDSYVVESDVPFYDPDRYKKSSEYTTTGNTIYTQLPPSVTGRTRELAAKITEGKTGAYQKAKAIEDYLRTTYTYDSTNVPYPNGQQDFVDQFLFDSKRGYCDHFSSSMVVLSRAVGLQARWVTGFTAGDADLSYEGANKDDRKYIVRNKNAHSWAEVFIPGSGWVPFEATATFSMPALVDIKPTVPVTAPEPTPKKEPIADAPTPTPSVSPRPVIDWAFLWNILAVIAGVAVIIAFWQRKRLYVWYSVRRPIRVVQGSQGGERVIRVVERLLRVLRCLGWSRSPSVTMRELTEQLSQTVVSGRELEQLTVVFEKARYGNRGVTEEDEQISEQLWKRIVRKLGHSSKTVLKFRTKGD